MGATRTSNSTATRSQTSGGEATERLRDDDQVAPVADRVHHGVRVLREAGRVVVAWKIRTNGVVASFTQFGFH